MTLYRPDNKKTYENGHKHKIKDARYDMRDVAERCILHDAVEVEGGLDLVNCLGIPIWDGLPCLVFCLEDLVLFKIILGFARFGVT